MSYDVKKLSETALRKILSVLEEIKLYSEIHDRKRYLFFKAGKLTDVELREQVAIFDNLDHEGTINKSFWSFFQFLPVFEDCFLIHIDDPFFDFYDKVRLELHKNNATIEPIKIISNELSFDADKSILYFMGYEIPIAMKSDITNAHMILEHIFNNKDGLNIISSFREISEDTFKDAYNENWKKYHRACEDIQIKVQNKTGINDFLKITSGISGSVRINDKYLK